MYIYEMINWPNFIWDQERINRKLIEVRHLQGRLIGAMESIGFDVREETVLQNLTKDIVKSSEIEGEILDRSLVRSSVARHLGLEDAGTNVTDRNIEGVVEMMLDATQKFDNPLTKERLLKWHATLFPNGRSGFKKIHTGVWRTDIVQIVSGHMGKETVHFEGPPPEHVDREMELFLNWVNQKTDIDQVLKSAIAHFWFVTIHPFDDGNGRIGRAIADMMLARSEKNSCRFYSLSSQIQLERKHYYAMLEKTSKGNLDITDWIEWFLGCLERAIQAALSTLSQILKKREIWKLLSEVPLNERQRKVINHLIEGFKGKLTSSKWAKLTKCSQDTAYRDILDLVNKGILVKNKEGGRSTSYSLQNNMGKVCQ